MVYRFRVTYEDHEDVYRDIEIRSSQTFLEFHSAIQQAISFDNSKPATFYLSDDYWRKEEEIITENTGEDTAKKTKSKRVSRTSRAEEPPKRKPIAAFVNDPHQKFIYVFDPEKEWTFQIELLKIIPEQASAQYPTCVKSVGTAPKQYKPTNLPPPPPEEEEEEPQKGLPPEKEEHAPLVLEKDPLDEEAEGFIALNEEGIEEIDLEEDEPKGEEEEPGAEEEPGESSEGFDLDDEG
ncbi:MAG: hypothetical protein ACHQHP_03230 [Bacteroidia bacterium]